MEEVGNSETTRRAAKIKVRMRSGAEPHRKPSSPTKGAAPEVRKKAEFKRRMQQDRRLKAKQKQFNSVV